MTIIKHNEFQNVGKGRAKGMEKNKILKDTLIGVYFRYGRFQTCNSLKSNKKFSLIEEDNNLNAVMKE